MRGVIFLLVCSGGSDSDSELDGDEDDEPEVDVIDKA